MRTPRETAAVSSAPAKVERGASPSDSGCYNFDLPNSLQNITIGAAIGGREDADLIARIKRRDPAAMGALYDRFGKVAYAVIVHLVPEPGVAEDLLAEAFVTAWNQIGRWKDQRGDDLGVWLMVLARNHALEHLRAGNQARPAALPKLGAFEQPALLPDSARGRGVEYRKQLRKKIEAFSTEERQILETSCFEGLPASIIAAKNGQPVNEIKAAIASALEKLNAPGAKP